MSDQRDGGISWTDKTWNPVRGCSRVSTGCGGAAGVGGCYAEKMAARFSGPGMPYEGLVRIGKNGPRWTGVVKLIPERLGDPLRWRKPQKIFVNSMSDLFHEALGFEDIAAVFGVMASAHRHTFQVLTKRPARAAQFFAWLGADGDAQGRMHNALGLALAGGEDWDPDDRHCEALLDADFPLPNVWIGVSVEDQTTADERIPVLLQLPAAVRFVSYEPALGPVRFDRLGGDDELGTTYDALRGVWSGNADPLGPRIDWIIIGGESGPGARPFDLAWARSTVAQCKAAGVAVFVKQLGAHAGMSDAQGFIRMAHGDRAGADPCEWPRDLVVREFPR